MIPAFKIRSRTIRYSRMLFFKKTFVTGKSKISLGTDFLILQLRRGIGTKPKSQCENLDFDFVIFCDLLRVRTAV